MTSDVPLIVTGANGRIGRLLRRLWAVTPPQGLVPVWLSRSEWDIETEAPPDLPSDGVLLDLAGVTKGDFERNPFLASKIADLANDRGHRLIYLSSAAVYPGGMGAMAEDQAPAPVSPYGRSKVAAEVTVRSIAPESTILRVGNIAGADALLGGNAPDKLVLLDQSALGSRGPVRSYIGPHVLAQVLADLCTKTRMSLGLGPILNVAQSGAVAMADLLDAAGFDWTFREKREGVIDKVELSLERLTAIFPVPATNAGELVGDLKRLGGWP